jgi:molybdopterin converting factor small subunit
MPTTGNAARHAWRIRLFGPEAAACGKPEVIVASDRATMTLTDLRSLLAEAQPKLPLAAPSLRFAVNHAFANDSTMVCATDEIAVIGMVSGG